jgi:hypothetical protein
LRCILLYKKSFGTSNALKPIKKILAKNRQMVTQFSENRIICCKFLIFEKKIRQKVTENWFFGDGVATFVPTGYNFHSFLK